MAKQLYRGCQICKKPFRLSACLEERKFGLASILDIKYDLCGCPTSICTAKTHYTNEDKRDRPAYDVNTKSAMAVLSSGIGLARANKLFAALNIPPMSERSSKKREREIGTVVE